MKDQVEIYVLVLSALLSVIALVLSTRANAKADRLQKSDLFLSTRLTLHGLLHESDRILLEHPELTKAFTTHATYVPYEDWSDADKVRFDIYFGICLNVYEIAYSSFDETSRIDPRENQPWFAWHQTISSFFHDCPASRRLWQAYKETFYNDFKSYVDRIIAEIGDEEGDHIKLDAQLAAS